jgi:hypothetical protein
MAENRVPGRKPTATEQRPAALPRTPAVKADARPVAAARSLQQRLGNRGTQALAAQVVARSGRPGGTPTGGAAAGQLSLSQPGDAHEREAESVADKVMGMTDTSTTLPRGSAPAGAVIQRRCAACEEEGNEPQVRRQEASAAAPHIAPPVSAGIDALKGGGSPLPAPSRAFFEPRFGANFDKVRVHTDSRAADTASAINARAFTVGSEIAFANGEYSPDSQAGRRLLAHELTHVVQQGQASGTTAPVQRDASDKDDEEVSAATYFATFAVRIGNEVARFVSEQPLETGTPYLSFPPPYSVGGTLIGPGGQALADKLAAYLAPASVDQLVDKGRKKGQVTVTDEHAIWTEEKSNEGPLRWFADVAVELGQALTKKMHDSLRRIVPRYIDAAVAVALEAEQKEQRSKIAPPRPTSADIIASHPIDHATIAGLCARAQFNYQGYRTAHPDARGARGVLRRIRFCWEPPRKGTFWIRVTSPADPSVEEVAHALFGSSTKSGEIAVAAAPLFGFTGANKLLPHHQWALEAMGANVDELGDPLLEAQEGPLADQIAKNQAAGLPTTVLTKGDALRLIDENSAVVSKIAGFGARFGMGKNPTVRAPTALLDRLKKRRQAIAGGDDAHARSWGPQIEAQQGILVGVSTGFGLLVGHLDEMTKKVTDATIKLGGFSLPPYVRDAMNRVAMRYADAMLASDTPGNGQLQLDLANEAARELPIVYLEGALAGVQRALDDARKSKRPSSGHDHGVAEMSAREESLRRRLATAKAVARSDPEAAAKLLAALANEITDLASETEMVANMDQIDAAWSALDAAAGSFWASMGTVVQARVLKEEGDRYHARWNKAYDFWKKGDEASRAQAKKEVEALRADPGLRAYFGKVQALLKGASREQLAGKLLTLFVITVVTAGVGEILAAGAFGLGLGTSATALSTGGAVLVGGGEAIVFTALSQALLDDKHDAGHIAYEFVANWVMAGVLRKFAAYAEVAKLSAVAKGGRQAVILSAMTFAKAEIDQLLKNGKLLTRAQLAEVAAQALVMYVAMHAVSKFTEPMFKSLQGAAFRFGTRLRANNETIKALRIRAAALEGTHDLAAVRKFVAAERAWLEERSEVLAEIEKTANAEQANPPKDGGVLKKAGMTMEQLTELRGDVDAALAKARSADVLFSLESLGPGLFKCPSERIDAIVPLLGKTEKVTTGEAGARTFEILTPDGKRITVIEKLDPHVEWLNSLKSRLAPDALKRLETLLAKKSAKALHDEFGGDMDVAAARLSGSSLPNDLIVLRNTLSPEARQAFDEKWQQITRGERNPPRKQIENFRSYLENLKAKNGGDLEAGLRAAKAPVAPAAKPPFGPMKGELPRLRQAADQLLAEINEFAARTPDKRNTIRRSGKRLEGDMEGVLTKMETGKTEATGKQIEGMENKIKGVQGEFDRAKVAPPETEFGARKSGREIDEITPDRSRWTNIKKLNLFGENDPRVGDLEDQARLTLRAAQLPENAVNGKAPEVEFHFADGVTPEVALRLRKVTEGGQSLIVTGQERPLKP